MLQRRDKIRIQNYNRFRAYREGQAIYDENAYQQLPLPGRPPAVYVPATRQGSHIFALSHKDTFDIDTYSDERFVPPTFKIAWRRAQTLKEHFAIAYPEFRYNRCLGWGGNGMAAVFDDIDGNGDKVRALVVKMLFSENSDVMRNETDKRECILSRDILF